MKTIQALTMMLAGAVLTATPLRAEEPAREMKCASPKKEDDAKKQAMKSEAAELDKLVDEMNGSTGDKKIEAMAAIINKMAQKQKEAHAKIGGMMMMMGMIKKDGKTAVKPGEVDYYTCTMHPTVRWPIPAKCPICSMELVPVSKKGAGAKPEAKPGDGSKKSDDPHAAHH